MLLISITSSSQERVYLEVGKETTDNDYGDVFLNHGEWEEKLLQAIEEQPHQNLKVLFVGNGFNSIPARVATLPAVDEVLVNDLSEGMVARFDRYARKTLPEEIHRKIRTHAGDILTLKQPSSSKRYHVIYMANVIHFLPPEKILEVMSFLRKQLQDGGRLLVGFQDHRDYFSNKEEYEDFMDSFPESVINNLINGISNLRLSYDYIKYFVAIQLSSAMIPFLPQGTFNINHPGLRPYNFKSNISESLLDQASVTHLMKTAGFEIPSVELYIFDPDRGFINNRHDKTIDKTDYDLNSFIMMNSEKSETLDTKKMKKLMKQLKKEAKDTKKMMQEFFLWKQ